VDFHSPTGRCSTKPWSTCTGPPKNTGCSPNDAARERDFHLLEKGVERHVDGAVHHDAQGAALVVCRRT
jgi:hypothetical protein